MLATWVKTLYKVWTVSWRNCNLLWGRKGKEIILYYWFLDAFLFHLKLIDIYVEGVAKHRPGACIVYNLRSNVLQISAFKTTEQAPSFSAYKIVCVQAL